MIEGAARLIVPGNDETLGLEPRAAQTQVFGTGTPDHVSFELDESGAHRPTPFYHNP